MTVIINLVVADIEVLSTLFAIVLEPVFILFSCSVLKEATRLRTAFSSFSSGVMSTTAVNIAPKCCRRGSLVRTVSVKVRRNRPGSVFLTLRVLKKTWVIGRPRPRCSPGQILTGVRTGL